VAHPRHVELEALVRNGDLAAIFAIATLDDVAESWARYSERADRPEDDPDWWAVDLLMTSEFLEDGALWRATILKLLEYATTSSLAGAVGAGTLENFVSDDEDDLRWIEEQCRTNGRFREALRWVWCDSFVTPGTMLRLDAAAGEPLSRSAPRVEWSQEFLVYHDAEATLGALLGEDWWRIDDADLTPEQGRAIDAYRNARRALEPDDAVPTPSGAICHGRVKLYKSDKGWGGIESDDAPGDVWVHFSVIEGDGFRELEAGEAVEFRFEAARQDSWNYRATWVRRLDPD
jgi:CspA family cold shock protein